MAEDDPDAPVDPTTPTRRIMIMISVVLGSTLYSTTLLIASTLLPQMQGAMSATQDEIAWAMTFNILATAVVTPMTGWLVAAQHAARPAARPRAARLDRLPEPRRGDFLRPTGAVARSAARLVRIAGDRAGDDRRRPRLLCLPGAQPDRRAAVPEPAAAARPQLRARTRPRLRLRHAQRDADGAAAALVAAACRLSGFTDRRCLGGARARRDGRVFRSAVHRQARPAHRHVNRLRPAGDLRAMADEHQS